MLENLVCCTTRPVVLHGGSRSFFPRAKRIEALLPAWFSRCVKAAISLSIGGRELERSRAVIVLRHSDITTSQSYRKKSSRVGRNLHRPIVTALSNLNYSIQFAFFEATTFVYASTKSSWLTHPSPSESKSIRHFAIIHSIGKIIFT